jgi:hypothetical protein
MKLCHERDATAARATTTAAAAVAIPATNEADTSKEKMDEIGLA